jgi:hypothetical protein
VLIEAAAWRRRKHLPDPLRAALLAASPWLLEEDVRGEVREVGGRGPAYVSTVDLERMPMTVVATADRLVVWGRGTKWIDLPPHHAWLREAAEEPRFGVLLVTELADSHPGISGRMEIRVACSRAAELVAWLS